MVAETVITLSGVPTEDFTPSDADAVTALLAQHGLSEDYSVHQREDFYFVLRSDVTLPLTPDVIDDVMPQVEEGQLMVVLNLYDEPVIVAPDDVVPGVFIIELLELLLEVVRRSDPTEAMDTFITSASRKGVEVSFVTWAEYQQVLLR